MKKLFLATFLFVALHAGAQESALLDKNFWTAKPDVATVKSELAKGFDFKNIAGSADPIFIAINNDAPVEAIKLLIDQPGVDLKRTIVEGRIYLHIAAHKNNAAVTDYLLEKGSDMEFLDANGHTALSFTAFNTQLNPATIDVFVKHGFDLQHKFPKKDGANLLLLAVGYDKDLTTTDYLLSKGLSIQSTDDNGNTVFDHAAKIGNVEVLKGLIKRGSKFTPNALSFAGQGTYRSANKLETYQYLVDELKINPHASDKSGRNILHFVVRKQNQQDVIAYFFGKGVDINQEDVDGNTPFMGAAGVKSAEVVAKILPKVKNINAVNSKGESALTNSVKNANAEVVALLLKNGADVKIVNKEGQNLVYLLAEAYRPASGRGGNANTQQPSPADDFAAKLELLKKSGLNYTTQLSDGNTLYHLAIAKNDLSLFKKLSSLGIDINTKNSEGLTVLHKAAMLAKNDEILRFLVEAGAKKDITTSFGETAFELASENDLLKQGNISVDFLK